jgi:hypothetical protein
VFAPQRVRQLRGGGHGFANFAGAGTGVRKGPGGSSGGAAYLAGGKWGRRDVQAGRRRRLLAVPEYKVCSDVHYVLCASRRKDKTGACVAVAFKKNPDAV